MEKQGWIEEANRNLLAFQKAKSEVERWRGTARQYAQNADYWRREAERLGCLLAPSKGEADCPD